MPASSQSNPELSKLKIVVLSGGIGEEREVSLQSGKCVTESLKKAGLDVITCDINPTDLHILDDKEIDVYFVALHGKFGEDGQLQQIFEDKGLVYTGSGPKACGLAFDKIASKKAFVKAGVEVPKGIEFSKDINIDETKEQLQEWDDKFVVKPIRQGSSVGVKIVDSIDDAVESAHKCLAEFGDCMIEEFIEGREITVGVLCDKALPLVEIRPKTSFYDYQAKYIDDTTEYLFDTVANPELVEKIQSSAIDCFKVLGCRDFARVDFILNKNDKAYVLEVNTIPGFTSHSLLPKAAAKAGLTGSDLYIKMVEAALENKAKIVG